MRAINIFVMIYSKEKIIEIVRPYFKNGKINKVIVTEDAQVFYESNLSFAQSHASVNKLKPPYVIVRGDIENKSVNKPEPIPEEDNLKDERIDYAKGLGLKVDKRMGIDKIESLIKDKENARE